MKVYLFLGLIVSLLFVLFIIQNTVIVSTYFLLWNFSGSVAITIILSFLFGVIISLLIAIPLVFKRKKKREVSSSEKAD